MPKKSSSRRWLKEHFSDPYVKQAKEAGFRSRATYKLVEIQTRDQLFKPGMLVVDLGAAPGGWSQVVSQWVKPKGMVIALDVLPMAPIDGVLFIQGDFSDEIILQKLLEKLSSLRSMSKGNDGVDWVISDMAPNMSGDACVDVTRSIYLAELALDFSLQVLHKQGGLLIKVFQGEGFDDLLKTMKSSYHHVFIRKPNASRSRSREVYLLAKGPKIKIEV